MELKQWEKNEWKDKIAKIEKDQACTTTNVILGKPFLDVCREAGVTPGKCPILKVYALNCLFKFNQNGQYIRVTRRDIVRFFFLII